MLTPGQPYSTLDVLYHLILLATLLSIAQGALIMRYMRSSLLEVLSQDYMRTALLPVITLIGSTIGGAIGGAIFIESVFNWPGMGLLMITAVTSRDYFGAVAGLSKHFSPVVFGRGPVLRAVEDVSCDVARGEVVGLVGESAAARQRSRAWWRSSSNQPPGRSRFSKRPSS